MDIYQAAIRPILFSGLNADPEWLHQQTLGLLGWLDARSHQWPTRWLQPQIQQAYCLEDNRLSQSLWGVNFANPIGLAAGFDKDGVASGLWPSFGFGFAELGTVTCHPQPGNPQPRLFRLVDDRAVLNRMGFNNRGAAALAEQLVGRWGREKAEGLGGRRAGGQEVEFAESIDPTSFPLAPPPPCPSASSPIGINLGKSKITPLEAAAEDYLSSFRLLKQWGDYFVVNVSSPNTPGLRSLQATDQLEPILKVLQQENSQHKPILVKIAPDLEWEAIAEVLDLAQRYQLAGIIATNTTIRRDGLHTQVLRSTGTQISEEAGGISGAPLRQRSTEVIRFIWKQTQGKLPIVGVGGVFTPEDAWEKITAGASLVQIYTGWVYEGPGMVRRILAGLLQRLEERGLESIDQAVGLGEE